MRQGSDIDSYLTSQSAEIKGRSEGIDWHWISDESPTYGTSFPLPADAQVRRINDGEAAIAKQADVVKRMSGQDKTIVKADRDAFNRDLEDLKREANTVEDRDSDSKPPTAETRQLLSLVNKINTSFGQGVFAATSVTIRYDAPWRLRRRSGRAEDGPAGSLVRGAGRVWVGPAPRLSLVASEW